MMLMRQDAKWHLPARWSAWGAPADKAVDALMVFGVLSLVLILLATYGNPLAGTAFLAGLTIAVLTVYRLDWGVYLFVGIVLLLDQFYIPGFDPYTLKVDYFLNIKEISYLPSMPAAVMNPLELHLVFLLLVWFCTLCLKKDATLRRVPVWGAALLFFVGVIVSFLYGLRRGGDMLVALWEIRALVYLCVLYFFIPQVIQTKAQVQTLLGVCMIAIACKAFQGVGRFARLGFSFWGYPTLTNHEDPVFMLSLFVLLSGLVIYRSMHYHRWVLLGLLVPLMMGFFVAQRRAAYAAIIPAAATVMVLMSRREWVWLLKLFLPVALVAGLYCAVFWNSTSRLASPIRLMKTGLSTDRETAGARYYSNLYRAFENYDLAVTVQKAPLTGVGFGNKYEMPIPLARISFPLRDYIPHNEILWVLVKMGAIGFFLFWFFVNAFVFRAASLFSRLRDPYLKAVCLMVIAAVGAQMMVSYFDLQLTYYRNMVYLGALMGLLPALEASDEPLAVLPQPAN
jgi:hypothetical protein